MAARNSWAVSTAGGILTTEDTRLHIGGLLTPGNSNVKALTGLRPGGSTAATQPGLVAAQASPDKTVKVNAFQMFTQTGRGAGTYLQCLDANLNIDMLTAHPADPSNQRNDLIIAQQNDTTYGDANNTWSVIQVVGTPSGTPVDPMPSGSTDYVKLARVRVTALAGTITSSMIDDLRPPWVTALGGVLPVASATVRGTLTPYDGMAIWRIDRKWIEVYSIAAGGWIVDGPALGSSAADLTSAITTPQTAQRAFVGDIPYYYDGTSWVIEPGQFVAGQYRSTSPAAIAGTETQILSVTVTLDRQSMYMLEFGVHGQTNNPANDFDMRIRDGSISGTILFEKVIPRNADAYPVGDNGRVLFQNATGSPVSKTFVATLQRIVGTGTWTVDPTSTFLRVTKEAPAGRYSAV